METKYSLSFVKVVTGALLAIGLGAAPAVAGILYTDIPTGEVTGAPEDTSWAGDANSTALFNSGGTPSFGSLIHLDNGGALTDATVVMSNYATSSYNANLILNLYQVNSLIGTTPGATASSLTLVATAQQDFTIPARPAADHASADCNPGPYQVSAGVYACGQVYQATFNLNNEGVSAGDYVWTVGIDSALSGAGAQSLNWSLNDWTNSDDSCAATLANPNPICTANNPQYATNYLNGVADGAWDPANGVTGWASIGQGEISISGTPEPATFGLIGLGLLGLGISVRKKSRKV